MSMRSQAQAVRDAWEAAGYRRLRPAITFRTGPVEWVAPDGTVTTNPSAHQVAERITRALPAGMRA